MLPLETASSLAEIPLHVRADDREFVKELLLTLGADPASRLPAATLHGHASSAQIRLSVSVASRDGESGWGSLEFHGAALDTCDADDFALGAASPLFPFDMRPADAAGWTPIALRGEPSPLFLLNGPRCRFRLGPDWRAAVALLIFHRVLRARRDAIFFHAAALVVHGAGLLLVGSRGAGKSTTALALAARGHAVLADDTAGYRPATGELIPSRRSVGIRPGPRAAAVERALARLGRDPEREGVVRLHVGDLWRQPAPGPTILRAVAFLRDFAARPEVSRIAPSRREVAELQPVVGSLVNAPVARRVFEMIRLLSRVPVFAVRLGDPEATAAALEHAVSRPGG